MSELRPAGYTDMEVERLMDLADEYSALNYDRYEEKPRAAARAALKAALVDAITASAHRAPVAATEATAREDAARYRWLRDMFTWEDCAFGDGEVKWVIYLKMRPPIEDHEWKAEPATWRVRERFDAAIDAARAASTGGSNAAIAKE